MNRPMNVLRNFVLALHKMLIMISIPENKVLKQTRKTHGTGLQLTLFCLLSLGSCTTDSLAGDAQQEVLAAHEKRRIATLDGDATVVASMMTNDLTFTHANAVVETKEQFVDALKSQRLRYKTLMDEDQQVRVHGSTGVVSGTCHIVVDASGTEYDLRVAFTELWVREADAWRMMLWHATEVN